MAQGRSKSEAHRQPIVAFDHVWKLFGQKAADALLAMREHGASKTDILERYGCSVGVADVSLNVRAGEVFCVMGLSGSGKSTLVRHVNRLIRPTAGTVRVLDQELSTLGDAALRRLRAERVGMVFQNMALFPHRSVRDNVAFPLEVQGLPKNRRWDISEEMLRLVDLEWYGDQLPNQLSGGMQQRVGLARALASDPELLLMDEPFSALDPLIRRQLQAKFLEIVGRLGKTALFITHDLEEAIRIGDRVAIMQDGRIVQIGTPKQVVMNPQDDYVADFVKGISLLKLIDAQSIMAPLDDLALNGSLGDDAHRVASETHLEDLIDIATNSDSPILVTNDEGKEIGYVDRKELLVGIRGQG